MLSYRTIRAPMITIRLPVLATRLWVVGVALAVVVVGRPSEGVGQLRFAAEGFAGAAANAPSSLTLRQDGEADIKMTARYDTRSFREPIYWSVRLSLLDERRAFELQLTHHKLHLSNPPAEVQDFQITHGFNLLTIAYAVRTLPVEVRAGGGVVFAHPEGTIRGRPYQPSSGLLGGHTVTGPVLTGGIGKRFEVVPHLLFTAAAAATATWANGMKLEDGSVDASNFALHLRFGLGYVF